MQEYHSPLVNSMQKYVNYINLIFAVLTKGKTTVKENSYENTGKQTKNT